MGAPGAAQTGGTEELSAEQNGLSRDTGPEDGR
jgi:hypothetical protein